MSSPNGGDVNQPPDFDEMWEKYGVSEAKYNSIPMSYVAFQGCVEVFWRNVRRDEMLSNRSATKLYGASGKLPPPTIGSEAALSDEIYMKIVREYFVSPDERHYLLAKDIWNAALDKAPQPAPKDTQMPAVLYLRGHKYIPESSSRLSNALISAENKLAAPSVESVRDEWCKEYTMLRDSISTHLTLCEGACDCLFHRALRSDRREYCFNSKCQHLRSVHTDEGCRNCDCKHVYELSQDPTVFSTNQVVDGRALVAEMDLSKYGKIYGEPEAKGEMGHVFVHRWDADLCSVCGHDHQPISAAKEPSDAH